MDDQKISKVSIGGLIIILAVIGYLVINGFDGVKESLPDIIKEKMEGGEIKVQTYTVNYENDVFSPANVKIKVGDSIKFLNNGTAAIRISSAPHPIHTSYPKLESGVIELGDSYTFTATEKVTIKYHNHLNPNVKGEIAVE